MPSDSAPAGWFSDYGRPLSDFDAALWTVVIVAAAFDIVTTIVGIARLRGSLLVAASIRGFVPIGHLASPATQARPTPSPWPFSKPPAHPASAC